MSVPSTGPSRRSSHTTAFCTAARSAAADALPAASEFIERVGRRKLIMPIYEALVKTPEGLELAKQGKVELRQDGLFRPIYLRTANREPIDKPNEAPNE